MQSEEIDIPALIARADSEELPPELLPTVLQIKSHWPAVRAALLAKREIQVKTQNTHTKTGDRCLHLPLRDDLTVRLRQR